jgi:hypothetical protein
MMMWIASATAATVATLALGAYLFAFRSEEKPTAVAANDDRPSRGGSAPGDAADAGAAPVDGDTDVGTKSKSYTISPKNSGDTSAMTPAEAGGEGAPEANAGVAEGASKAPRKKFSELTAEEKRRYQEGRSRRANFRRSRIATAKSVARDEKACSSGDATACARLNDKNAGGGDRVAVLAEVKTELSGACNGKDLNACIHRGDLDLVAEGKTTAAGWYEKAKKIAGEIKASCDAGAETNRRKCARARRSYDQITKREQRLAANDTAGPLTKDGSKPKKPRLPRPSMGKLFRKGKEAPRPAPLAPLEAPAVAPAAAAAPASPASE